MIWALTFSIPLRGRLLIFRTVGGIRLKSFTKRHDSYAGGQSEIMMGAAVKKYGWNRNDIVISTKVRVPVRKGLSVIPGVLISVILFSSIGVVRMVRC